MSSGLPINTFAQANEFTKRYMATLALQAQNDAYNLQANQTYKQTGQQPSRPPDTRSTTEKLADIERLKVDLRSGLQQMTDAEQANETIEQLSPDEIQFTTQQLPAIVADLKPKFARGVPAAALVSYIRNLRRKFLATNGVSFSAQESTAQDILNALQAGINMLGANPGPFGPAGGRPSPGGGPSPDEDGGPSQPGGSPAIFDQTAPSPSMGEIMKPIAIKREPSGTPVAPGRPPSGLPIGPQSAFGRTYASDEAESKAQTPSVQESPLLKGATENFRAFYNDPDMEMGAIFYGPISQEEWDNFPQGIDIGDYMFEPRMPVQFLEWWADAQDLNVKNKFAPDWRNKRSLAALKKALTPGVEYKLSLSGTETNEEPDPFSQQRVERTLPASEFFNFDKWRSTPTAAPREPTPAPELTQAEKRKIAQEAALKDMDEKRAKRKAAVEKAGAKTIFRDPGNLEVRLGFPLGKNEFSNTNITKDVADYLLANDRLDQLTTNDGQPIRPDQINYSTAKAKGRPYKYEDTNLRDLIRSITGTGMKPREQQHSIRRTHEPPSRFPIGRHILGYGLRVPKKTKKEPTIDMTQGIAYEMQPTFVPFGKYIVNPSKLSQGVFDMRTRRGNRHGKYPITTLSPKLKKHLNRIVNGGSIDSDDFEEMEIGDQEFLFNLANESKINDRLQLPTPKRSKEDEENNRFEILKGQLLAGNDNKELIKEFKQMLVRFSNDGRIKKTDAREILLDLAAAGH
jgi:hypothetical protein